MVGSASAILASVSVWCLLAVTSVQRVAVRVKNRVARSLAVRRSELGLFWIENVLSSLGFVPDGLMLV